MNIANRRYKLGVLKHFM